MSRDAFLCVAIGSSRKQSLYKLDGLTMQFHGSDLCDENLESFQRLKSELYWSLECPKRSASSLGFVCECDVSLRKTASSNDCFIEQKNPITEVWEVASTDWTGKKGALQDGKINWFIQWTPNCELSFADKSALLWWKLNHGNLWST